MVVSPFLAVAQREGGSVGMLEPGRAAKAEPAAEGDNVVELPYSQIFRDAEPPYGRLFRDVGFGGVLRPKAGSADALFETRMFGGPFFRSPLESGPEPAKPDLKLGPFYLKVVALSASLLYSDNVNLTATNRRDGIIGIVRVPIMAGMDLGDNLQFRMMGRVVYLPFRGEIGVAGFGIHDPLAGFEGAGPVTQAQLTYDFRLGGWTIEVFDNLMVSQRRFGAEISLDLFNGESFDEEDRAGRYAFGDSGGGGPSFGGLSRNSRFGLDLTVVANAVGASAGRLLPTETLFQFGFKHIDYFYPGTEGGQLPSSRDVGYVMLVSERETLRFKPFAVYRVSKYGNQDNWDQQVHAGIQGPVTENLLFFGHVGYFEPGGSQGGSMIWNVRLRHNPNPLTYQQVAYVRGTTEPDRGMHDSLSYRLNHIFRPNLVGSLYAMRSTFESIGRVSVRTGEEDRVGLRFYYDLAQRTTLEVGGTFTRITHRNPAYISSDNWTARARIRYDFGKSFIGRLTYYYHERDAFEAQNDFYENLVVLTLIKHF